MSAYETNHTVPLGSITTLRVVLLFERAIDAFTDWRNSRATAIALGKLSDAQLDDIGLHRGNIAEVAEQLARN